MKKLDSKLFSNTMLEKKVNLTSIVGGNKSDKFGGYSDTSLNTGGYDVSLPKLRDVEPTTNKSDKPLGIM